MKPHSRVSIHDDTAYFCHNRIETNPRRIYKPAKKKMAPLSPFVNSPTTGNRLRGGVVAVGRSFICFAGFALLVFISFFGSPAAFSTNTRTRAGISRRLPGEHVTLSDCRDKANVFSSQAAYFPGDPGPTPQDVAVVATAPGEAALWVNTNTSALFTGTGVIFTASLGPKVNDGEYAGTGENGYTTFTCWQRYRASLYEYDKTTCSQVYECNHDPMPSVLPTPVASQPSESSTPTPSAEANKGLAQGALIGIVVGAVGGFLFLIAAVAVFWFWRKTRKDKMRRQTDAERPTNNPGAAGIFPSHLPPFPTGGEDVGKVQTMTETRYEMDGRWYRVEMSCEHGKVEMDAEEANTTTHTHVASSEDTKKKDGDGNVVSPLTDSPTLSKTDTVAPSEDAKDGVVEEKEKK
ncbi:hypothetical protein QBC44DRAFT_324391 [Cladorrhinum sp. PSN332]|nr:hypothetical protein QBC44DRAFT_324391 [Cladorrhinum sp. PSN332]